MEKPKVAIFDLTDCEGCELGFVALKEKIPDLASKADITNWRIAKDKNLDGPFDVSFIEGAPLTEHEIELIKEVRAKSKLVIALGSCACIGGIPGVVDETRRSELVKHVYSEKYKANAKPVKPVNAYIGVDYYINGCPVDFGELENLVASLLIGKIPERNDFSVCMECKAAENNCYLVDGTLCLGVVTKGGCKAVCPTFGLPCFGCQGAIREANIPALEKRMRECKGEAGVKELKGRLELFFKQKAAGTGLETWREK